MSFASLGTDTGGSIRIPASFYGIVGIKPTYGKISNKGTFPLAKSLDHIGPMAKSAKDAALLLNIISNMVHKNEQINNLTGDIKGIVIGLEVDYFYGNTDSRINKIINNNLQHLIMLGAKLKVIKIPYLKYSEWIQSTTIQSEFAKTHQSNYLRNAKYLGKDIRLQLEKALHLLLIT